VHSRNFRKTKGRTLIQLVNVDFDLLKKTSGTNRTIEIQFACVLLINLDLTR
jgi:hypothetical protein